MNKQKILQFLHDRSHKENIEDPDEMNEIKFFRINGLKINRLEDLKEETRYVNNENVIPLCIKCIELVNNPRTQDYLMIVINSNAHFDQFKYSVFDSAYQYWKKNYSDEQPFAFFTGIGNIYSKHADDSLYDQVIEIMEKSTKEFNDGPGGMRGWAIKALGNMRHHPEVFSLLKSLQENKEYAMYAWDIIEAFGKHGDPGAIPYLELYLTHKDAEIRNLAKKTIAKLERIRQKKAPHE